MRQVRAPDAGLLTFGFHPVMTLLKGRLEALRLTTGAKASSFVLLITLQLIDKVCTDLNIIHNISLLLITVYHTLPYFFRNNHF